MATAKAGDKVKIHYTGKLDDGTVFDSSSGREPLDFELGAGAVIPGFDAAVTGMSSGENKTVRIEAEEAYGPRREDMIMEVNRSEMPADMDLEVGMQLQASPPGAPPVLLTVVSLNEETVTLDGNHPLAGQALTFEIELTEIAGSGPSIIIP